MAHDDFSLRRRSLLATSAAALAGSTAMGRTVRGTTGAGTDPSTSEGTIPPVEFFFPNALLNANREPLRDESLVAVEAEPTAELQDAYTFWRTGEYTAGWEGDGTLVDVPDDAPLPLVAIDDQNVRGTVVGAGSLLAVDGTNWERGNAEFLLNLIDVATGRAGGTDRTVLFHEYRNTRGSENEPPQDLYWRLDRFSEFTSYASEHGYTFFSDLRRYGRPNKDIGDGDTDDGDTDIERAHTRNEHFIAALQREDPDAVVLPVPNAFEEEALLALERYVDGGGAVLLLDSSDLIAEEWRRPDEDANKEVASPDPSRHLNAIADHLGVGFRFNDALVTDDTANAGASTGFSEIPVTTNFSTETFPDLFEDRPGREPTDGGYRYEGTVEAINDGDTITLNYANEKYDSQQQSAPPELRFLGVDTPEPDALATERPVEWEGLADNPGDFAAVKRVVFADACSLLDGDGDRLTDPATVPVRAEPSARNEAGDDGAVAYDDAPIPLVGIEGSVACFGSLLVSDLTDTRTARHSVPTFDFLLNVWDVTTGGGATVLYDEGHGQPVSLDDHGTFLSDEVDTSSESAEAFHRLPDHYDVRATDDLRADLSEADAVWLTPPAEPFTDAEAERLRAFLEDGGSLFVHGRAEATGAANPEHLNDLLAALDVGIRFNDDTVLDAERNDGTERRVTTAEFTDRNRFPFFALRQVHHNSGPWDSDAWEAERLKNWAEAATQFAYEKFERNETTEAVIEFDPDAGFVDGLGRLLTRIWDDPEEYPNGKTFQEKLLERGLARVYDSSHLTHDDYLELELEARRTETGVWRAMNTAATEMVRNRPVEEVFVPQAASVRTADGPLDDARTPVFAEPTAEQAETGTVAYDDRIPLVGVDEASRLAMVGGPLVAENYEVREDGQRTLSFIDDDPIECNTAGYENFTFLTNLLDALAADDREGDVLIDSGHLQFAGKVGRFGQNYTVSGEDARYYERFLEGIGIGFEALTDLPANLPGDALVRGRALLISTPETPFDDEEVAAIRRFRSNGGSVVLLGSAEAPAEQTGYLNDLAARLGSDLRLNDDAVVDDEHHLRDLPTHPTTTRLNDAFDLFDAHPDESPTEVDRERADVRKITFDKTGSLLDENGRRLTTDDVVAVWAEPTAVTTNADFEPDHYPYRPVGSGQSSKIPLVAVDGAVVGFGGVLVDNQSDGHPTEFVLNVWDELVDGRTVLWDDGHGQGYSSDACSEFIRSAELAGYDVRSTFDVASDLDGADAVVVTSPPEPFSEDELARLRQFREDGGAVFLHDRGDTTKEDGTPEEQPANLNAIAAALELPFRFNDDTVLDSTNNAGVQYVPVTSRFNDDYPFFGDATASELAATGTRGDGADVYTAGQTARIDVTLEELSGPVDAVRVVDAVPAGWTVYPEADAATDEPVKGPTTVDLGTVSKADLAASDGGVTRTYLVEATGDTGPTEFGPAAAVATADASAGESSRAEFGGTDTNVVVGVDQNDPAGSATDAVESAPDAPGGATDAVESAPDVGSGNATVPGSSDG